MANTVIRLKKSSISGREPTTLEHGELAINYTDGKLFYRDDANVIQRISGGANSFMYMNVAGTMLVAGVLADVLTINEGDNIQINTDALTNKYTITANLRPAFRVANAAFALANDMYNVSTVVSNTAPSNPVQGKLWWNSILGTLFVYYVDPDGTTSWVEAVPNGGGTSGTGGGGTTDISPAFNVANAAFGRANAAYSNANSTLVLTQAAFTKANSANVLAYNTGIGANNYAGVMANAANAYAASLTPNLSPVFQVANAAYNNANSILVVAQAAFDRANSSNDVLFVAASFDKANAANVLAAAAFNAANNAGSVTVSNTSPVSPISGDLWWNTDYGRLLIYYTDVDSSQWVDTLPVSAYISVANTVNSSYNVANASFGRVNTTYTAVNSAFGVINAAFTVANASYTSTNGAASFNQANVTYTAVNSAFGVINAAFLKANSALANTSGAVFSGNFLATGSGTFGSGATNNIILSNDGSIEIQRNTGGAYIDFKGTNGGDFDTRIQSVGDGSGNSSLIFSAPTERVRIANTGNVGIGTTNPLYKLDVNGTINASSILINGIDLPSSSNSFANAVGVAANTFANAVGVAANTFANTKLANTNVVLAGNLTSTQGVADRNGDLRNLPIVNQTSSYTLSLADNGEVISITTGNVFVTAGVFFPGNTVSIFNNSSANITITQNTSVTLYSAGTSNTGNRILQQRGIATLVCVADNTFVVTGAGMVP